MTVSSIAPRIRPNLHAAGRDAPTSATTAAPAESRALVSLSPVNRSADAPRITRPNASFVAHLIATAEHCPQIRVRRQAAPQDALAVYGSVLRDVATDTKSPRKVARTA
ncbi:MAG TPA: hypothetical protein VF467_03635 [Afipia sp.]